MHIMWLIDLFCVESIIEILVFITVYILGICKKIFRSFYLHVCVKKIHT